jgi:hypothetical protein
MFTLSKIVMSTYTGDRPLEVVDEDLLDEDMTRMDTNIIRTYLGRDMDDEYVICLCTTIHAKDKVSLFLCYIFTYFENSTCMHNPSSNKRMQCMFGSIKDE